MCVCGSVGTKSCDILLCVYVWRCTYVHTYVYVQSHVREVSGFHREGGWHWDFHPPGKVSPLQVLKKYSTANGMQVADFMWMKLLSIECMIQLMFAILEKNLPLPDKNPV